MGAFNNIYKYNLLFYIRTKRFSVMLPLALVVSLINTMLIEAGIVQKPTSVYLFTEANLAYSEILFIILSSMFAGDLISRDFSKEGLYMLTQPISREKIFLAKYISAVTITLIVVLVYMLGVFGTSIVLYNYLIPNWYEIVYVSFLAVLSLLSFVTLFSAIVKSPTISITISIFILLIIFPLIQQIMEDLHKTPFFVITYALQIILALAQPNITPFISSPSLSESIEIFVSYLIFGVIVSMITYKKRQLSDV
ncbi:ABC transporter permease subunit [Sulfurisphaera ohwakuensis]|uniref:ABC transporter permease subunit n=2 Tax=Sulfurisphaera ohwakuensis TaxID=69656 RepID=A0A650CDZ1_SULOH|nr:ABC transporter permease subunit [Sulfurisphaera ohwakuensis]